jgi:hypothetical protein
MMDLDGINENVEESAVLQDIENNNRTRSKSISELHEFHDQRKETHTPSREVKSRPASTRDGTSELTWRARMRKNSSVSDTTDYAKFETAEVQKRKGFNKKLHKIRKVFRFLFPDLGRRINIYIAVLFLLTVSYTANSFSYTYGIFRLYGCTLALELICSVIDRCVYKLIDAVFITHFNIAYQLHAINGPLGFFLTILIIGNFWHIFRARSLIDNWDTMVTVAAVFIICLAAKNWLSRRQYIYLLEQRFTDKVESLNTTIIILSELASTRPPKTSRLERVRMGSTATCNTDATALTNASKLSTLTDNVAVQGVVKGGKVVLTEGKMLAAKVKRVSHCRSSAWCQLVVIDVVLCAYCRWWTCSRTSWSLRTLIPRTRSPGRYVSPTPHMGCALLTELSSTCVLLSYYLLAGVIPAEALVLAVRRPPHQDLRRHPSGHLQRCGHAAVAGAGATVRAQAVPAPEQGRQGAGDVGLAAKPIGRAHGDGAARRLFAQATRPRARQHHLVGRPVNNCKLLLESLAPCLPGDSYGLRFAAGRRQGPGQYGGGHV